MFEVLALEVIHTRDADPSAAKSKISPGSSRVRGTIAAIAMTADIVSNAIIAALSTWAVARPTAIAKSAIAEAMEMLVAKPDTMHAPPRKYD